MGRGAPLLFRALIQLWIASLPVSASDSSPEIPSDAIDRFVRDEMGRGAIPGMALAVTRYGQVAYLRGYGAAHKSEPVMPQTQFLLASLSKSFTAIAVLQQVERGRVALDAPVQRYLPDFHISDVAASSRITVRELLNQTSGLSDAGFPEGMLPQPTSIRERVESLRTARLVAPPGAEFHYFNPNYAVLARLVEVIAGQGFDDYMREHVFAPLGMANTFHADTSQALFAHAVNVAQGHLMIFGFAVPCPEMSGYLGGSAGVASTAADMARYLIFQSGNGNAGSQKMLSRESIDLMHTPPRGLAGGYAMGWVATQEHGVRAIEHNGILSAYYAEMIILPDRGIGIALLYNVESVPSMMFAFGRIKSGILALLMQAAPHAKPAMTVRRWGALLGILTVVTVTLGIRSFLRRHVWLKRARWQAALQFVWWILPGALLVALPWIVLQITGRSFGYEEVFRAMPGLAVWLAACGVVGAVNAISRISLLRRARSN